MNEKLIVINELTPIAKRIRERQADIESGRHRVESDMCEVISAIQEQGRDIILAKSKLGKVVRWGEWLQAHVPQLSETIAAKYERVVNEQITSPRQCAFAFLPPSDPKPKSDRAKPDAWEICWGFTNKLKRTIRDNPPKEWPKEQLESLRREIGEIFDRLAQDNEPCPHQENC